MIGQQILKSSIDVEPRPDKKVSEQSTGRLVRVWLLRVDVQPIDSVEGTCAYSIIGDTFYG